MKLKNVQVGQRVKVKETNKNFYPRYKGQVGTVLRAENPDYSGYLTVHVKFTDGTTDWGSHKDIKLIKE